ncbi:MAG: tRNA (adenosine(37)-N6)-threonylcarbamoyltransferase complex ATPase subunit type 1 TsaE [Sphingobacteriales bacterium]|jgi:tRNA threonylcarbamoyladenosine biosynthesis protein TsaE|nr:MAG: tRNA (adenosine(37)-N6)-threonylcarbamoyltransferase complex ATPase subunit type 1 TsaE [Sphingobacteriales bacterium]
MDLIIENETQLRAAAQQLLQYAQTHKVFVLYGEMGAGKTTLITHLCACLGVQGHTSSPTFAIVNEYHTAQNTVFHFDFYRLKNQVEALDLGYEEYFYSGAYCFIEWPEKIPDLLPSNYLKIQINVQDNNLRILTVSKIMGN